MHQPVIDEDPPECPGEHCQYCSGAACAECGAGLVVEGAPYCDHDVIERHAYDHPDGCVFEEDADDGYVRSIPSRSRKATPMACAAAEADDIHPFEARHP